MSQPGRLFGTHAADAPASRARPAPATDLAGALSATGTLPRAALVERWKAAYGRSPPNGISQSLLEHVAAYDLQAKAQALQRAEVAVAEEDTFSLTASLRLLRRGAEARLILGGSATVATPDKTLIAGVAQVHRWFEQLASGEVGSIDQIAARDQVDASDVGRQIRLAFLAPGIVAAILAGTQPVGLTAKRLGKLPLDWEGQLLRSAFVGRCRTIEALPIAATSVQAAQ